MSCSFDGPQKRIIMDLNTTSMDVKDIYSLWKQWAILDNNLKYLPAFEVLGGDPLVGGKYLGTTFFLANGWKIRPYEGNHTLILSGNLYTRDGSSPFVNTLGNYNVLINLSTSNLVDSISTSGGGDFPTTNEIASAVNASLQSSFSSIPDNVYSKFTNDMIKLLELYTLMGLDPTKPLIVTPTQRVSGTIQQSISENEINKIITVTRTQ